MPKPLTASEPFPQTKNICRDALSLGIISSAYATSTGELNAILQYNYHSVCFKMEGHTEIADTLDSIAVAEMFHLKILGECIFALGAPPVYAQFPSTGFGYYNAKYVAYSRSLENMLEDDIVGERIAISGYLKMLKALKNENVSAIISRILSDEKLHLETLQRLLSDFKCSYSN